MLGVLKLQYPRQAANWEKCCVGGALTLIPLLTGNGMSMAFESAEHAIVPLTKVNRSGLFWAQARNQIAQACDTAFTRRVRWAAWLQGLLFRPHARSVVF